MKKIKKAQLDTLISMNRGYWNLNCDDDDLIKAKCKTKLIYARKTFGDIFGMGLDMFIGEIVQDLGLKPTATNEDIYKVLEVLGYEVTE